MAKTLLDGVNEVLKRVNEIAGDGAALTQLVDSSRQHSIDVAIQVINEGIDYLYSFAGQTKPNEQGESTLVLVQGQRDYTLAADLVKLLFPLIDRTNTQFIFEYAGGYNGLLLLDPEQNDTGLAVWAAINPKNGQLHLDRAPEAADAGKTYTYEYEKDLALSAASDQVPFLGPVFRAMVPAWVQLWKRERRQEFDTELYREAIGVASRYLSEVPPRTSYSPR